MGKTRAEIQKAYRERKKAKEGVDYLNKETTRVKRYYRHTYEIAPKQLEIRREKVRNCMRKKRALSRQKYMSTQGLTINAPDSLCNESSAGPCDSTTECPEPCSSTTPVSCTHPDEGSTSTSEPRRLVVNMKFKEHRPRGNWKKSKALKSAGDKIKVLELRVNSLKRRNETLKKRLQRRSIAPSTSHENKIDIKQKEGKSPISRKRMHRDHSKMTPRSKSKTELRDEGISPSKHQKLVKKLIFHNTIVEELKEKIKPDRGRSQQRSSLQIVCGKVLKKYRLGSSCSRELGVNRGQILKSETRKNIIKSRKNVERKQVKASIISFLEREDNSACMPGKRDATKTKSGVTQIRVLNDYLYNLHLKFKSENPAIKVSLTTFASNRPGNIKLVKYTSRRTCLCQKHQNIALKVKGLKIVGAINTDSPDMLIRQNTDEEIIHKIKECESDTIKFSEWKRKEVNHKGRISKRMMVESVQLPKAEFIEMFQKDLRVFRMHVERVKCQYEQIKALKEKLPQNHAICQMDFAENYSCCHAEEIQTAYFDKCSVTLHPVVIYTKDQEGSMIHKSYMYVSDTQTHNSGTVFAFMKQITEKLKSSQPDIACIHYITDSPTSQYRNKSMMYIVANHDKLFGMSSSWQYWEAGHGKGPCDGVGGTSKRQADLAVKRQTAIIQSARDYYNWGMLQSGSQTKYCFVSKEECDIANQELSLPNLKPIKGTLDIHSVAQLKSGEIAVRHTSCFCDECFHDGQFKVSCNGWVKHSLNANTEAHANQDSSVEETQIRNMPGPENITVEPPSISDEMNTVSVNSYVAAVYNGRWYVGKVIAYDPDDEELPYQISFMEHGKGKACHTFKWPITEDIIWTQKRDILCTIDEPIPHGTRRMFNLQESDQAYIHREITKVLAYSKYFYMQACFLWLLHNFLFVNIQNL